MASSTTIPTAMANPDSVMTLIEKPCQISTMTDITSDNGIAVNAIKAVRKLKRKTAKTTVTKIAPSRRASFTVSTARRIRSACTYSRLILIPSGREVSSELKTDSTLSVKASVFTPGCLTTLPRTVSIPFRLPAPRRISGVEPI